MTGSPKNGDVPIAGFESFYRAAKDGCFRAVAGWTGDLHEAEDLVDEAFVRAAAAWATLATHPCPEGWVVTTARNLARDRGRRRRRWTLNAPSLWSSATPTNAGVEPMVDERLLRSIANLPVRQREVVVYRILLDLDTAATAAELGMAPGTVTTHLRRALARLRSVLASDQEQPRQEQTRKEALHAFRHF